MVERKSLTKMRAAFGRLPESFSKQIGLRRVGEALQFVERREPELVELVEAKAREAAQHLEAARAVRVSVPK